MFKHKIIKKFLNNFYHIRFGSIEITMPDGKVYNFIGKEKGQEADLIIYDDRAFTKFATKGDIGFTESYRDKWCDSKDLLSLFMFILSNEETLKKYIHGSFLAQLLTRFMYLLSVNTIKGSKKNIHTHYDLGNSFYELWLDPSMTYSSAIFPDDAIPSINAASQIKECKERGAENDNWYKTQDLTSAQYRKYDRIIENLGNSGSLLEIGCGWGGFAERAIFKNDYDIKAITISQQQYLYAKNRLKNKALIASEDYRIQEGKYDQIVSIEMFEAVGERFWDAYFSKVQSLLKTTGRAIIQTITINESCFERYRKSGDPIRTFIFPGGMLPSPERFIAASSKAGLVLTDRFSFGKHYALTLHHWLSAFENKKEQIKALGFDEKFLRIWRFYLTFCIASFQSGRTDVMQLALEHDRK